MMSYVVMRRMHHKVHWKVFMLQEGSCMQQLYANAQDTAMGAPILLIRRPQTNNIAVMQHAQHNQHRTQHRNLLHVIVIHNCDYHSSYSYPCGYVFQLQRYSCNYYGYS